MTTRTRSVAVALTIAALFVPTAFASAATAIIQNLSSASPLANTSVSFSTVASGFSAPAYHITDSFSGTSISSSNINLQGSFYWVPSVTDIGTHTITMSVTDSGGNTASATQVISVLPPPSISIQSVSATGSVMPGTPFTFSVSSPGFVNPAFSVSDSYSGTSGSTAVHNTMNTSGYFSWTPDTTQNGDHAITVYATDTQGHSAQATVVIRIGSGPRLTLPTNINTTIGQGQSITFTVMPADYSPSSFSLSDTFGGTSSLTNNNISSTGIFVWNPTAADAGTHQVTFFGQVGVYGTKASTTVTINVLGANGVLPVTQSAGAGSSVSALQSQLAALQAQIGGATNPTTPAVGSSYIFTLYLKQGSENDEVLELQKVLSKLGFLKVTPNGYFGPSTVAAVKKFQAAHGLDQLGAVGPGTRLELNSLTSTSAPVTAPTTAAVSGSVYVFEHFMGVGDDDPDVLELQKRLVSLGFLTAAPTGYYGAGTEAAVKKFQTKHGLPATGYVAKNTRAELNK